MTSTIIFINVSLVSVNVVDRYATISELRIILIINNIVYDTNSTFTLPAY